MSESRNRQHGRSPLPNTAKDQEDEISSSGTNSFFDSEETVEDCDLNIPTSKGVPDIVPFATLETGHYLGLNYLFNDAPRRT